MSSYRRALKRTRAELARERGGYEVLHTGRHPLRKVRVGDRVQVRVGEVLTVVTDVAGSEVPLGHVQAGASGVFVIEAEAAKVAAKVAATAPVPAP